MQLKIQSNFTIQFTEAGLTLSCGVGPGHYCDNHGASITDLFITMKDFEPTEENPDTPSKRMIEPKVPGPTHNMEVALIPEGGGLIELGNDTVAPYVPLVRLPGLLQVLKSDFPVEDRIQMIKHLLEEPDYD